MRKFADRRAARAVALEAKLATVTDLRTWLQERRIAAQKSWRKRAEVLRSQPRGVDRVPAHLRFDPPPPVLVHGHRNAPTGRTRVIRSTPDSAINIADGMRRVVDVEQVDRIRHRTSNTPYLNPARDLKRHARLRKP